MKTLRMEHTKQNDKDEPCTPTYKHFIRTNRCSNVKKENIGEISQ